SSTQLLKGRRASVSRVPRRGKVRALAILLPNNWPTNVKGVRKQGIGAAAARLHRPRGPIMVTRRVRKSRRAAKHPIWYHCRAQRSLPPPTASRHISHLPQGLQVFSSQNN